MTTHPPWEGSAPGHRSWGLPLPLISRKEATQP
jgi:hypothetical protein